MHEDNSDDVSLKYFVHLVSVNERLYEMEETSSTTKKCPHQGSEIIVRLPGPKGEARGKVFYMDCFNLFMYDTLVRLIVTSTKIYINLIKNQFERGRYVPKNLHVISSYICTPKVF